jgi:signal transduction histidine kinase
MPFDSVRSWLRLHPLRADSLLALGILGAAALALATDGAPLGDPAPVVLLLVVAGAVPVAIRRWRPWWAVEGVMLVTLAAATLKLPDTTGGIAVIVVLYTVAAVLPLGQAAVAGTLLSLAVLVDLLLRPPGGYERWISSGLVLLVCFSVGRTVATRHAYTRALEERARTAESSREASAREAVLEERRRIARELHDVVAHHVSVMGVLATGARRALHRDPESADEALATIEATGRATLREMRRLLDVLRNDGESDAALQPQPGLAGLEALAEQVREAGLDVRLVVTGTPRPLDPGIDLTIYRIVQEGLTNALKHAGPASATVSLDFRPAAITLRVDDNGAGAGAGQDARAGFHGHGLVGMRERVSLYGGTLRSGPRGGEGYSVAADIPLDPAPEVIR